MRPSLSTACATLTSVTCATRTGLSSSRTVKSAAVSPVTGFPFLSTTDTSTTTVCDGGAGAWPRASVRSRWIMALRVRHRGRFPDAHLVDAAPFGFEHFDRQPVDVERLADGRDTADAGQDIPAD